jgi:glycosyl transferase family 25
MQIPGYYINLDSAVPRRRYMKAQVNRLGLPITRMAAQDGAAMSDAEAAVMQPRSTLHKLAKQELACFLSHRECWIEIANGAHRFGAVFEDDLAFSDDAVHFLCQDDWLPAEAELVKVETTTRRVMLDRAARLAPGRRILAKLHSRHLGAGGYVVSKAFAAKLVAASEFVTLPVDYALFNPATALFPEVEVLQLNPAICVQQCRSREVFLPVGVPWSDLNAARVGLKARGWAKLRRELVRPFAQIGTDFGQTMLGMATGRRWTLIRFRK